MINLAQMDIRNMEGMIASASDYLETWDDSDNITAINARKRFETSYKMLA